MVMIRMMLTSRLKATIDKAEVTMKAMKVGVTPEQVEGLRVWRELHNGYKGKGEDNSFVNYAFSVIHDAHQLWRDGKISADVLAVVVDETMCY